MLGAQAFTYDAASNRTGVQAGSSVSTESVNNLNQLTGTSGGGPVRFAGTVSKPASVTVGGNAATVRADGSYEGWAPVAATGTTRVHVVAKDAGGNVTDNYANVTPAAVAAQSFGYDPNGNQTSAGPSGGQTLYGWDAADRLVTITQGSNVTRFDYDGQSRRVRESLNGAETRRWVWAGLSVVEERDAANNVKKRFFAQGEQINGQPYFYTRDHLGSVRELTDSTQTVRARYDYDVYGLRSANQITSSPVEASFGFTGHYFHAASGLHLAPYRAYDAKIERWISRDPTSERGGINLYGYVNNNPVGQIDLFGLDSMNLINPKAAPNDIDDNPARTKVWIDRMPTDPNTYTVAAHGNPYQIRDSNSNPISPEDLAILILKDPNYNMLRPVKLNACSTGGETSDGSPNYAQQLANDLNNTVIAPTDILTRAFQDDTWTTLMPTFSDIETVQNGGTWKNFTPTHDDGCN